MLFIASGVETGFEADLCVREKGNVVPGNGCGNGSWSMSERRFIIGTACAEVVCRLRRDQHGSGVETEGWGWVES